MAGIYIHVPFCKKRCFYCSFFSTTMLNKTTGFIDALKIEIEAKNKIFETETIETIYFGGGTPSLLSASQIADILLSIKNNYKIADNPEITIEANPDDISSNYVENLAKTGVNRLSIGIQSFIDTELALMNRRHNAMQAISAVYTAQKSGFNNISIDLIYGIPNSTVDSWQINLDKAAELNIQHLSAYHLTYENGTVFYKNLHHKKLEPITEELSIEQFNLLNKWANTNGFDHYEISNFAKPGLYSRHNTAYWQQKKYLGFGPSAHSYNIDTRSWNISNLVLYINYLNTGVKYWQTETLTVYDKINDYLITALRTMWGINTKYIANTFGLQYADKINKLAQKHANNKLVTIDNGTIKLTQKGIMLCDNVLADLIVTR